ncbi:MAG: tail fiber protein, partial [Verrucomicrobia bacterium]|nr:tail fiber protein [Verrucomicrobiota bacterium]
MKTNSVLITPLRLAALCLLTLAAGLAAVRAADGNPPDKMSYQSYLVDAGGFPLGNTNTGPKNYDVVFRIWNDQIATTVANRLWTEQQTITVDKGYFSVILGEGGPYSSEARPSLSSVFTNKLDSSDRFIEMTVRGIGVGGGDSTVAPRLRLLPTPYAFLAKNATQLGGVDAANFARNDVGSTFTSSVQTPTLYIGDSQYTAHLQDFGSGQQPVINFDAYDYLTYSRSANKFSFMIGNSEVASITSSGIVGGGSVPLGGIIMWSGSSIPSGWALCDGSTVNGRQTPDLRGRFVVGTGQGSGLSNRTLGQTGGEENHVLTWNEMPSHNHGVNDPGHRHYVQGDNSGGWNWGGFQTSDRNQGWTATDTQGTGISIQNAGNYWPHNTMPPFYAL